MVPEFQFYVLKCSTVTLLELKREVTTIDSCKHALRCGVTLHA